MIYSSESVDEKVKLMVVQSSFKDVIQAMYSNERQSAGSVIPTEPSEYAKYED